MWFVFVYIYAMDNKRWASDGTVAISAEKARDELMAHWEVLSYEDSFFQFDGFGDRHKGYCKDLATVRSSFDIGKVVIHSKCQTDANILSHSKMMTIFDNDVQKSVNVGDE
jgi:hypothetical protein